MLAQWRSLRSRSQRLFLLPRATLAAPPARSHSVAAASIAPSSPAFLQPPPSHPAAPGFATMNVTRHNFKDCFADLKIDIELPTCRFIAIDTEFTGLSPDESEKERFIDTLEERYKKVKRAGESFLITQFGLSTVHIDEQEQFLIKTWNFYVFPRPYGQSDERFLCQASSLQFLSEHGFDFNKCIGDGIPFINLSKTETMKKRLEKRIDNLKKPNKNLSLSGEGLAFQKEVTAQLSEWIDSGDARKGLHLTIPARNSFLKMVAHETVRVKANYLYSESSKEGVEVRVVTNKAKEALLAARAQSMRDDLDEAIGFSRVMEVLSACKKPIIGHNALLDFVYVFNQFYRPLPDTLAEFKQQLAEIFPTIYDTKHIALRSPLAEKLSSTSLSSLFEYMRDNVKPTPENLLSNDPQFEGYRAALKADSDDDANLLCHEAGFDAFMTGVCFLGLLAHDAGGNVVVPGVNGDNGAQLENRMVNMETYKNCINLMISDEAFLDLGNLGQTIDRSHVYRVSTNDRKRRIQHVKLEELFTQPLKINRVLREGDRDAFVFLAEAAQLKDTTTTTELGVTVTPFEEYMELKRVRRTKVSIEANGLSEEEHTPTQQQAQAQPGMADESGWNRCTIS